MSRPPVNDDRLNGSAAPAVAEGRGWNQRAFVATGALLSGLALPISGLADHAAGGPGGSAGRLVRRAHLAWRALRRLLRLACRAQPPGPAAPPARRDPARALPAGRCSRRWRWSAESRRSRSPTDVGRPMSATSAMRSVVEDPRAPARQRDSDALRGPRPLPLRGLLVLRRGLSRGRARQGRVLPPQARRGRGRRALHGVRQVRQGVQGRSAQRWRRLRRSRPAAAFLQF